MRYFIFCFFFFHMKTSKSGVHFTHTAQLSSLATIAAGVAQES